MTLFLIWVVTIEQLLYIWCEVFNFILQIPENKQDYLKYTLEIVLLILNFTIIKEHFSGFMLS